MQINGQKRDKQLKRKSKEKNASKKVFRPQLFWQKAFDMDFPQKVFHGVFELPLLRNTQKRHKQIKIKLTYPIEWLLPDIRRFQILVL